MGQQWRKLAEQRHGGSHCSLQPLAAQRGWLAGWRIARGCNAGWRIAMNAAAGGSADGEGSSGNAGSTIAWALELPAAALAGEADFAWPQSRCPSSASHCRRLCSQPALLTSAAYSPPGTHVCSTGQRAVHQEAHPRAHRARDPQPLPRGVPAPLQGERRGAARGQGGQGGREQGGGSSAGWPEAKKPHRERQNQRQQGHPGAVAALARVGHVLAVGHRLPGPPSCPSALHLCRWRASRCRCSSASPRAPAPRPSCWRT